MTRRSLKFEMQSYWHIGSGAGSGSIADAVVARDACGLPFIPGRTVKGLLRDAMELATISGAIAATRINHWFGSALPGFDTGTEARDGDEQEQRLEQGRFSTTEGRLWFGSARLPDAWLAWAPSASRDSRDPIVQALVTHMASTAIDDRGVARNRTLRVTEVAVPMTLESEVRGPDGDTSWVGEISLCLPLLRAIGRRRNRGLGRVLVTLEEV